MCVVPLFLNVNRRQMYAGDASYGAALLAKGYSHRAKFAKLLSDV
jgi:hypothetical protein